MQNVLGVLAQIGCTTGNPRWRFRHPPRRSDDGTLTLAVIGDEAVQPAIPELLVPNHIDSGGALARRHTDRPQPVSENLGVVITGETREFAIKLVAATVPVIHRGVARGQRGRAQGVA